MACLRAPVGVALGFLLAFSLPALPAGASQFEQVSLESLTRGAEAVVRGRVVNVVSEWSDDEEAIFTYAVVEVRRTLRGDVDTGERILVKEVGGTVGDFTVAAIGLPAFHFGDDLVLFLSRWEDGGHFRVADFAQGFYRVSRDRLTGVEVVQPGPLQEVPDQDPVPVLQPVAPATRLDVRAERIRAVR